MAATLKLTDIEASSGSTITVAPATTLSLSADKLSVGGVLLSQGNTAVNVLTSASTDLADATHTAMWTGKSKAVFAVDASGGTKTVQLPAASAAGRSTVSIVISVKAVNSAVTPYMVTVNNSVGTEVFTLYQVGDFVEFVSDGTNDLRTGNEHISAQGQVYLNTDNAVAQNAVENMFGSTTGTIRYDRGNMWDNSTNYCLVLPYACRVYTECLVWTTGGAQHIGPVLKRYPTGRATSDYIFKNYWQPNPSGSYIGGTIVFDYDSGDEIEFGLASNHSSASMSGYGSATAYYDGCYARWQILRRY
jgi:hypothetical protein